jgi:phosphoglycolate phosphatase
MNGGLNLSEATRLQACIVDLDGTLVDTLGDFEVALNHMLATLDRPPVTRTVIGQLVGKGSEHLIRSVLVHVERQRGVADFVAPEDLVNRAWRAYQEHYLLINGRYSAVYAGVREGLLALRERGLRLACLTNKPTAFCAAPAAGQGAGRIFQ